jgi:hypothetical protein
MKLECPRCQQDWIKKVHIGAAARDVFLCDECEAIWFCLDSIEFATFLDLRVFLERRGIKYSQEILDTIVVLT